MLRCLQVRFPDCLVFPSKNFLRRLLDAYLTEDENKTKKVIRDRLAL